MSRSARHTLVLFSKANCVLQFALSRRGIKAVSLKEMTLMSNPASPCERCLSPSIHRLSPPPISALEPYEVVPEMPTLDITGDVVEKVAKKMSGAAGPGGTDAIALQHWLLRFGVESSFLRDAVASLARFMANGSPPSQHMVPSSPTGLSP